MNDLRRQAGRRLIIRIVSLFGLEGLEYTYRSWRERWGRRRRGRRGGRSTGCDPRMPLERDRPLGRQRVCEVPTAPLHLKGRRGSGMHNQHQAAIRIEEGDILRLTVRVVG